VSAGRTFAVVGGGVSGIAAAWFLDRRGFDVEVIEREGSLGGRIGSCRLGDRWLDFGGKNIGRRYHRFRRFTASLGDNPYEYFGINSSQVRDGKIVTFDSNRRWRSMFELLRHCSAGDVARFARLLLRVKWSEDNGYLGSDYFNALGRRLDARPASAYFSSEFARRVLRPMTVRMNGAEPDEVYMGNLGSNIRMVLDSFDQLERGMNRVLDQFGRAFTVRLGERVDSLLVHDGRAVGLRVTGAAGETEERRYRGVVLATPAPIAASLVEPVAPELAHRLRAVSYYPVALVLAQYDRPVFSPEVRALVFDAGEVLSNAGSYGAGDLDLVRYTFSGKAARAFLAGESDEEAWLERGEQALGRYIPVDRRERRDFVARRFDLGLCAYTPDCGRFAAGLEEGLRGLSGLYLTGDYLRGSSIEACFRAAESSTSRIAGAADGG